MRWIFLICILIISACSEEKGTFLQTVNGKTTMLDSARWLTHEHILVDFIGAEKTGPHRWDRKEVINEMQPYLLEAKNKGVKYFVDATPNYLGRDVKLLKQLSENTGLEIITNTGLYGAGNSKHLPEYVNQKSAWQLAKDWINEFKNGIDGTEIRPGFIKISVDAEVPLKEAHQKIVRAAALTHLETGLTIGSHTGPAKAVYPQLEILKEEGVSPNAFIWIHAGNEEDQKEFIALAKRGLWISIDGFGWEPQKLTGKIKTMKSLGVLDRVLISHDAGWYRPDSTRQDDVKPYTAIFEKVLPKLRSSGFDEDEIHQLLVTNPQKAFSIRIRQNE